VGDFVEASYRDLPALVIIHIVFVVKMRELYEGIWPLDIEIATLARHTPEVSIELLGFGPYRA
jgi:hypothetical protein